MTAAPKAQPTINIMSALCIIPYKRGDVVFIVFGKNCIKVMQFYAMFYCFSGVNR